MDGSRVAQAFSGKASAGDHVGVGWMSLREQLLGLLAGWAPAVESH